LLDENQLTTDSDATQHVIMRHVASDNVMSKTKPLSKQLRQKELRMNIVRVYRMLLYLYPNYFRQQFSEEMVDVFRQRAHDLTTRRGAVYASFVLREYIGLPIGAAGAWIGGIMPKKKYLVISIPIISEHFPKPTAEEARLSTPELQRRHDEVQATMFQAAANHDFVTARFYEAQVARLHVFLDRRSRPRKSRAIGSA
jgi:hypothetical protein